MTHAEVRTLVARYAAGTLEGPAAETVRAHLASGCADCFGDLYARPVGLPRANEVRLLVASPSRRARWQVPWRGLLAVLGAAGLGAVAAWTVHDGRQRVAAAHAAADALAVRLAEVERERTALATQTTEQAAAQVSTRAELARQAEELAAATQERAALAQQLAAAEARIAGLTRGGRRREAEIERLLGRADAEEGLRDLAAAPGLQLLALTPVAPFREPRGHVLWRPGGDRLVLYAFDLPQLPAGTSYALRVASDGTPAVAQRFVPGPGGDAVLVVPLGTGVLTLLDVEVVREPPGEALLAGQGAVSR